MEQEIDSNIINKYVDSLSKLSIITGKLDSILLYLEQIESEDKFISSSLESVLEDILEINGNKQYIRMNLGSHNIASEVKSQNEPKHEYKRNEEVLNAPEVQIQAKKISQPLNTSKTNLNNNKIEYTFKNSTNLKSLSYTNIIKVRITFQNGRVYDYLNVPENKIKTLITCDKNNISPGKYFNSEIRGLYEYREVTHDYEVVG